MWAWGHSFGSRGRKIDAILCQLDEKLDKISSEVHHNGGGSLKDIVVEMKEHNMKIDAFLRAQLNIYDVAIVRTDKEGNLYAINRQYQRLTGLSLEEVQGDGWVYAIHPDDREKVVQGWAKAVANSREYIEDIRFINTKGECFPAHAHVYRETDSKGALHGYLGVISPLCESDCPWKPLGCDLKCTYQASARYSSSQDATKNP